MVAESTESFGSILGDRADTVGRHCAFVAATYQFFAFSSLDGIDLKHLPAVYRDADTVNPNGTLCNPAVDPPSPGNPPVELECITTRSRIDLKVHQVAFYPTYGLTSRIEVSAAVPFLDVSMGVPSNATIVRTPDPHPTARLLQAWQQSPTTLSGILYPGFLG